MMQRPALADRASNRRYADICQYVGNTVTFNTFVIYTDSWQGGVSYLELGVSQWVANLGVVPRCTRTGTIAVIPLKVSPTKP